MTDVADRHLRDKTDAIAYIIRNISEQCAAAVEGLDLARRAESVSTENDDKFESGRKRRSNRPTKTLAPQSEDGELQERQSNGSESEFGDSRSESGYLRPMRSSNLPPTPDLVHDRSSTSMSVGSESTTATPQRHSLQSHYRTVDEDIPEVPTRFVDNDSVTSLSADEPQEPVTKFSTSGLEHRRAIGHSN